MADQVSIEVTVNGEVRTGQVEPRRLLADFLREDLGLTGTHLGCEHGVCGACTVLLDGLPARSCLTFAVQADGCEVRTVEGLVDDDEPLPPLHAAFHEHHALQCGFCTPGFLLTAQALLDEKPSASDEEIRQALSGVLCRCTGYQNIVTAVQAARDQLATEERIRD